MIDYVSKLNVCEEDRKLLKILEEHANAYLQSLELVTDKGEADLSQAEVLAVAFEARTMMNELVGVGMMIGDLQKNDLKQLCEDIIRQFMLQVNDLVRLIGQRTMS